MKRLATLFASVILFISCASSQRAASQEAKNNIAALQPLLELSEAQVKKLEMAETDFLEKSGNRSNQSGYEKLKQKRDKAFKKVLTRQQYIRFRAVEDNRIKKVPVRASNQQ